VLGRSFDESGAHVDAHFRNLRCRPAVIFKVIGKARNRSSIFAIGNK